MDQRNHTLYLPLTAEWYEKIEKGLKTEEYREIKPFWVKRIARMGGPMLYIEQFNKQELTDTMERQQKLGYLNEWFDKVQFTYGYTNRNMLWEINDITVGQGNVEWGAPENEKAFVIHLGERLDNDE